MIGAKVVALRAVPASTIPREGRKVEFGRWRLKSSQSKHSRRQENRRHKGNSPRKFYTVSQLAELLQLNEMIIYRRLAKGVLPPK
jgi:hypothetical protein